LYVRRVAVHCLVLLLFSARPPPALLSFPTRRSSDLVRIDQRQVPQLGALVEVGDAGDGELQQRLGQGVDRPVGGHQPLKGPERRDRKSTRLNSSHGSISYAVFCLTKKTEGVKFVVAR